MAEELNKNVVFIFKIKIDGAIGDTRLFGNLRYRGLVEALVGKYFYGSFEYAVIFVIVFFFTADGSPPGSVRILNECSFIQYYLSRKTGWCQEKLRK
jgi:hypothetical protein